jgi:uncharacterized membrane protein
MGAWRAVNALRGLVLLGVLTGQSLTAASFRAGPIAAYPGDPAVSAPTHTSMPTAALQPRKPSEDDTPWGFFRKNVKHADSPGKWLALLFFTTMMAYFYLPRLLIGIAIVVGVLALVKAQVRESRLVRIGLVLFFIGFVVLNIAGHFTDNPLGAGFLLAFLSPVAAVMMLLGAIGALLKRSDTRLNQDIAALVASAERSRPLWPDEPPLAEVDQVSTHGSRAGSALLVLLGVAPSDPSGTSARNVHVEQQAELALCRIYSVSPMAGETVRDARSTAQENTQVTGFWRRKVSATKGRK